MASWPWSLQKFHRKRGGPGNPERDRKGRLESAEQEKYWEIIFPNNRFHGCHQLVMQLLQCHKTTLWCQNSWDGLNRSWPILTLTMTTLSPLTFVVLGGFLCEHIISRIPKEALWEHLKIPHGNVVWNAGSKASGFDWTIFQGLPVAGSTQRSSSRAFSALTRSCLAWMVKPCTWDPHGIPTWREQTPNVNSIDPPD